MGSNFTGAIIATKFISYCTAQYSQKLSSFPHSKKFFTKNRIFFLKIALCASRKVSRYTYVLFLKGIALDRSMVALYSGVAHINSLQQSLCSFKETTTETSRFVNMALIDLFLNPYPADCNYCAFAVFAPNRHKNSN